MPTVLISPLTLYTWDNTIFDKIVLPQGIDKDIVVNTILVETEQFSTFYTRPDTFKLMVELWSKKHLWNWTKLWETTQYEYNPIENYDRRENETSSDSYTKSISERSDKTGDSNSTETRNLKGTLDDTTTAEEGVLETRNLQNTSNETRNLKDTVDGFSNTNAKETNSGSDVLSHYVSAFNTPDAISIANEDVQKFGKVVDNTSSTTNEQTTDYTGTDNWQGTDTGTIKQDRDFEESLGRRTSDTGTVDNVGHTTDVENRSHHDDGSSNGQRELRSHGNIGVTTTQQMIEQEREISKFNIYDVILQDFKREFCVLIY